MENKNKNRNKMQPLCDSLTAPKLFLKSRRRAFDAQVGSLTYISYLSLSWPNQGILRIFFESTSSNVVIRLFASHCMKPYRFCTAAVRMFEVV